MGDYPWAYKRHKRRFQFETVPNCETTKDFVREFSKRTGISQVDTRIFMRYLKQFLVDAIDSNARINFYSMFKLTYTFRRSRKLKDINGNWVEYSAVVRPKLTIPRRLADAGRQFLSKDEEKYFIEEDDDDNDDVE